MLLLETDNTPRIKLDCLLPRVVARDDDVGGFPVKAECCADLFRGLERLLLGHGERVLGAGVGRNIRGRLGLAKAIANGVYDSTAADEDSHDGTVKVATHRVFDDGDVEPDLGGVSGLAFASLQLGDDVAQLLNAEENQVKVAVVAVDVEVGLAADEGETGADLAQGSEDTV